ncbi:MAG TPA: hypothetical protein VK929_03325 [Longimicrobiales bacterium]|nr:hypothetical protein [Longimicrobiales bacterium]
MNERISVLYARYAAVLLALTLVAGAYLRSAFVWPAVRGGLQTPHVIHAHSHGGFFGWMVMAAAAGLVLLVPSLGRRAVLGHRLLAHGIGIGSVVAFVGFALRGYDALTITVSAVHVAFWITLAALLWRPLGSVGDTGSTSLLRAGLAFLVVAGAMTVVPAVMMVRQVTDPWLVQFGVKLFLTPFVSGFLLLTALGFLYRGRIGADTRNATTVVLLVAVGALPSTLLYVPGAPAPVLVLIGRLGIGLVGAALLLATWDLAASATRARLRPPPLPLLAVAAAAAAGLVKLAAAAGVGAAFMHNRSIVVAVLHLILLGLVTPALLHGMQRQARAGIRTLLYASALVAMLAPLAASGWPWAARMLMLNGIGLDLLLVLAAVGGILTVLTLLALTGVPDVSQIGSQGIPAGSAAAETVDGTIATSAPTPSSSSRRIRTPAPYSNI